MDVVHRPPPSPHLHDKNPFQLGSFSILMKAAQEEEEDENEKKRKEKENVSRFPWRDPAAPATSGLPSNVWRGGLIGAGKAAR